MARATDGALIRLSPNKRGVLPDAAIEPFIKPMTGKSEVERGSWRRVFLLYAVGLAVGNASLSGMGKSTFFSAWLGSPFVMVPIIGAIGPFIYWWLFGLCLDQKRALTAKVMLVAHYAVLPISLRLMARPWTVSEEFDRALGRLTPSLGVEFYFNVAALYFYVGGQVMAIAATFELPRHHYDATSDVLSKK